MPSDVLDAVVTVLADWARGPEGWGTGAEGPLARPCGVVTMASRERPQLVASLGARIAEIGRMPLLGTVAYTEEAETGRKAPRSNSAQRLRSLEGALRPAPDLASALTEIEGPVLLVDDFTETGWTLAMAARMLRRAGATGVLPLVLAVQG